MAWRLPNRFGAVARGECDRCGFEVPHRQLRRQAYYNGTQLTPTGWMVCRDCYDEDYPKNAHKDFSDPKPLSDPRYPKVVDLFPWGWQIDGHEIQLDGRPIYTGEPDL